MSKSRLFSSGHAALLLVCTWTLSAQVNVLTQRGDNARTGQNTRETVLTPTNVNTTTFGKLFSVPVDGLVYAQPLYFSNVAIPGKGTHNVIFVATEHDSIYAFDADSHTGTTAAPLWQISLLDGAHGAASGASTEPSTDVSTQDISPEIGITATPVIDPSSGTMYVVGETVENGYPVLRLHALGVTTGAEKFGGPIVIQASVAGTGNGSSGGVLNFDPKWSNSRAGLLLQNGVVYIAFASHGDNGPWHGWVLGYNATTLRQTGAYCTTPSGIGGGIWMAGTGIAGDVVDPANHPFGRMFVATGNGWFTAMSTPYSAGMDFSDDQINLDLSNGIPTATDSFTPYNQQQMDQGDWDVGSGGVLLLPDQTSGGPTHLLVQAGKWGTIYLVNRDNMGGYSGSGDNVVQEITGQIHGLWGAPAYWNNLVYFGATDDQLKAFSLSNGQLSTTPVSVSQETYQYPGVTPTVSSNGSTNGIVWTVKTDSYSTSGPAVLAAHDAMNLASTLYSSDQNAARDNPGNPVKFTVPVVANGKVYVAAQYQVSVYGLLNGQQPGTPPPPPSGSGSPSNVDFTQGFSTSSSVMTFNGSTDLDDTRLQLTNGGGFEAGSAFYNTPLNIQSFTTDFTFQLSTAVADGMTFTIQNNGPSALGGSAGGLGYSGITNSVAVKFDLYNDAGEGNDSTGLYSGGAMPTVPATDLSASGIDLHSGDTMAVHITYDGTTLAMKITDGVTGASFSTTWSVNIPSLVGGSTAYVGFTGGTGGSSASQKVEGWTFVSNAPPTAQALVFYPVPPCRVADTRNPVGPLGGPSLAAGATRSFPLQSGACGIPADAAAYSLNATVVPSQPMQYLTLWPAGQSQPYVSTLNSFDGRTVANAAIVPAGASGAVSAYATGNTDLILDINGYFAPASGQGNGNNPSIFVSAVPCRALDTRNSTGPLGGPGLPASSTRDFPIPSSSCGVPTGVSAYSTNVTAIPNGSLPYLTLWPTGQTQPYVSTLNALEGDVVANAAIVPAGSNGSLSVYAAGPTDVALDLNGYFVPYANTGATKGTFIPVTPCRVVDTRLGAGTFGGPTLAAGTTRTFPISSGACGVPANAQAYILNVTAVPAGGALQYLTLWPAGQTQPYVSTLNSTDGRVVANAAIVPAGTNGAVSVYVTDPSDVILDISGYISP